MTRQIVNVGASVNDGTGDLGPRGWLQKYETNFNEAYAGATALAPLPGLGWFHVKAYGAIGNGIADDTTAVQAAIAAAQVAGGVVYNPLGFTCLLNQVTVAGSFRVTFAGQGTYKIATTFSKVLSDAL